MCVCLCLSGVYTCVYGYLCVLMRCMYVYLCVHMYVFHTITHTHLAFSVIHPGSVMLQYDDATRTSIEERKKMGEEGDEERGDGRKSERIT